MGKVTDVAMGSKATKITTGYIYIIHMSYFNRILFFKKNVELTIKNNEKGDSTMKNRGSVS